MAIFGVAKSLGDVKPAAGRWLHRKSQNRSSRLQTNPKPQNSKKRACHAWGLV